MKVNQNLEANLLKITRMDFAANQGLWFGAAFHQTFHIVPAAYLGTFEAACWAASSAAATA